MKKKVKQELKNFVLKRVVFRTSRYNGKVYSEEQYLFGGIKARNKEEALNLVLNQVVIVEDNIVVFDELRKNENC